MDSKLLLVTQSGSVDDLYSLIQAAPDILQKVDVLPIIHTPLHEASSAGKLDLAMELMILKPSFAKKLNEYGLSPLHLAVENDQVELALELVKVDPSLVRIRGRGDFLLACPESIKDVNVNGETILHITIMNDKYEQLKVLTGWMQKMRDSDDVFIDVLNRRDRGGNTVLHLAAYENNDKVVKQLVKCLSLDRNIQNKSGMTALDVLRARGSHMNKEIEEIIQMSGGKTGGSLSGIQEWYIFLREPVTFKEHCKTRIARYRSRISDGSRNALLVIAALIISATFQTAAQLLDKEKLDKVKKNGMRFSEFQLWGCNTVAFSIAILFSFILLPVGRAYEWWYFIITVPLVFSYFLLMYMMHGLSFFFLIIYEGGLFLVYLLVLYVKWKRCTQMKVRKPKSDLISDNFKNMV
ncbi:ankyrin-repeat-containing protein-like [Arabidopsis thaliana]|nr:ankyrin-repeat-containing protein-like [Arabidopsis thaliana]